MGLHEKWNYGFRTVGNQKKDNKKVEVFVKIRTSAQLHRLKQQIRKTCEDENVWIKQKISDLEDAKKLVF